MTSDEILAIFKKAGGYISGSHVVYTSGKHGQMYMNKDAIYPHTAEISKICEEMALRNKDNAIDVVAAPALGGIILSQWTAHFLSLMTGRDVLGVYTEKTPEKDQIFTRGYDALIKGKNVLVVEDITTTGGSVLKVVESVRKAGGIPIGICVLVNRNPKGVNSEILGLPYQALCELHLQAWDESECPLCKKGVPVNTTVGKGREFLAKKKFESL